MSPNGTSRRIVVRNFDIFASSAPAAIRSPSRPLISPAWAMISSTLPYWASSVLAVFSPTPLMPGMLSDVSPARAR